jgi:tetratricopeptide (TPR) repeat protein
VNPMGTRGQEPEGARQIVTAVNGFAYGVQGADIHVFGDGTPVYLLENRKSAPQPDAAWLRKLPNRMLNARYEVVSFVGRDSELADLGGWRETGPRLAARWLHAPGGQGKTRLAARFADDSAAAGWKVVTVIHGPGGGRPSPGSQDMGVDDASGLLVIVDYADQWPLSHLTWLFSNALLHQLIRTRVLFVARTPYAWPAVRSALDNHQVGVSQQLLSRLPDEHGYRERMFIAARDSFSAHYGVAGLGVAVLPGGLDHPDFGLTLMVHMAALVAVDAHVHGRRLPQDPAGLTRYLLDRERQHWTRLYENRTKGLDYQTPPNVMSRAVFTSALTGPVDYRTGKAVLAELDLELHPERILADHAVCYPPTDPARSTVLEPLYPDRLAEDFLALTMPGHDTGQPSYVWASTTATTLLTPSVGGASPTYSARAVTFLAAAAGRWPHLRENYLYPLLHDNPRLAVHAGSAALSALAAIPDTDIDMLSAIEELLPDGRHVDLDIGVAAIVQRLTDHRLTRTTDPASRGRLYLTLGYRLANAGQWEQALTTYNEAINAYRGSLATEPIAFEPDLAGALNSVGVVLAQLGRREEALAATAEAVDAFRRLAAADAVAYLPGLAMALTNLSIHLSDLGRWKEAVVAAAESVETRRRLVAWDTGFKPDLAISLINLGARLCDLGRLEEGLTATSEAVDALRALAQIDPAAFEPEFAAALNNLGTGFLRLGRRNDALTALNEAVELRRRLAKANPAAFEPALGESLINLGSALEKLARRQEALAIVTEAVEICRRGFQANPAASDSRLGPSLISLGGLLTEQRRLEEALAATTEAVEVYRRLVTVYTARFEPDLATALTNLGVALSRLGRRDEALKASAEAVGIRRRLVRVDSGAFEPDLALELMSLGTQLSELGRRNEALTATSEAVEVYRRLAQVNPAAFQPDLASALSNLSADLSDEGRREEALVASTEAVDIRRQLTQTNRAAFEPDLAKELVNLGSMRFRLGMQDEGLSATAEAVEIYRRLAHANPEAFEPGLATVLSNVGLMLSSAGRHEGALTSSSEAVGIFRRLVQRDRAAFEPDLARALRAAAAVRALGNVELPQALNAAEESVAVYRGLAASYPAAFLEDFTSAQHTVADILNRLGRSEEAAELRDRANDTGRSEKLGMLKSISRVLVSDNVEEQFDEAGLTRVLDSLYPVDCQTCGRSLGSAPPVLHVDDYGSHAYAALHHPECKSSEWNRAASGVLIVRGSLGPIQTWASQSVAFPVARGDCVAILLPMLLLNPSLESVLLERDSGGHWRVSLESRFHDAGMLPPAELQVGMPIGGVTARIKNGDVLVAMRDKSGTYKIPVSAQTIVNKIRELGGLILAVTHAVNPAAVTGMQDLEPVFAGDRSLMGWVEVERSGS